MKDKDARRSNIRELGLSLVILGVCVVILYVERLSVIRRAGKIPLKICITGTRGKSGVTRLIAGALRQSGFSVMAKTTGSRPMVLYPDGSEEPIKRRGSPSLLEWKKILKLAESYKVQVLVGELMSIRPESLFVESNQMLRPHVLAVTNVRPDHTDVAGQTRAEIALTFAAAIPSRCTVLIPEKEMLPEFSQRAARTRSRILKVGQGFPGSIGEKALPSLGLEFEDNIRLALAVTDLLGADGTKARSGLEMIPRDYGGLKIWEIALERPRRRWFCVSSFAANDPLSTRDVLDKLKTRALLDGRRVLGLLNLRKDRGDRTRQWLEALDRKEFPEIAKCVLVGDSIRPLQARFKKRGPGGMEIILCSERLPENVMGFLSSLESGEAVVLGLGNIGGLGQKFVEHWERTGIAYGL